MYQSCLFWSIYACFQSILFSIVKTFQEQSSSLILIVQLALLLFMLNESGKNLQMKMPCVLSEVMLFAPISLLCCFCLGGVSPVQLRDTFSSIIWLSGCRWNWFRYIYSNALKAHNFNKRLIKAIGLSPWVMSTTTPRDSDGDKNQKNMYHGCI